MTRQSRSHILKHVPLLLILLLAAVARFRYLTEIEHNVDHAYSVWQAMTTLDQGVVPLTGQGTSVLFANPPLTGYLFMLPVALTRSPLGVYIFVITLNTLAVWMAYRAVEVVLGRWPALMAAALLAVNPWMIEYSRTSWVQSLMPFFVSAVAWLLWPVLLGQAARAGRRVLLALVTAALFTQTYLLAYFILLPIGLLLWLFRQRVPWRAAAAGAGVIVLFSLLYGMGLLNQIDTVQARVEGFTSSGEARLSTDAWEAAVRLVSGSEYELARGLQAPADDTALRHDLSRPAYLFLTAMIVLGIGAALAALARRTPRRDAAAVLMLWFLLPILAMSYTSNPVHSFYQILGVPAGYALAAWGLLLLTRSAVARGVVVIVFVPFAALMLTNSARYYQETATIPGAHDLYALPVDVGTDMGEAINALRPSDGVVFAQAEEWILNSFAGRLFPVVTDTRAPAFNIVPHAGGAYVTIGAADAVTPPHFATETETIALPDGNILAVSALPSAEALMLPGTALNVPSAQGLTLGSYTLTQEGDTHTLTTYWRVESIAPEVLSLIYAPFLHLIDATGERVAIVDGEGLAGFRWSAGDVHVHQMTFIPPEDSRAPYRLLVGQFDGLHNANIVFLPPTGEPSVVVELPETLE